MFAKGSQPRGAHRRTPFSAFLLLSPLESAHPRPPSYNPCRMNTSRHSRICIKTNDFNPIRMNTSKRSRHAKKTKDFKSTRMNTSVIYHRNPFRIRTSKKSGGRGEEVSEESTV